MYIPNSYGTGKTFRGNRFNASEFEEALEKGRALYKVELAKVRKVSEDLVTAPMWTMTQATKYFGNMSNANRRSKFGKKLNAKQKKLEQMKDEKTFSEKNKEHLKLALEENP